MVSTKEKAASRTNWAMIFDAAGRDGSLASQALEQLVRRYWPAVYAYIRRSGHNVDHAADLTQGFICDVMLDRHLLEHADPKRGRFRSFLLNAVKNYLREVHRIDHRAKRQPKEPMLQLAEAELEAAETNSVFSPEQAFAVQWVNTLIRRVVDQVRTHCNQSGMEAHWGVFESRVVRPMLADQQPVPYSDLVKQFDLTGKGQAANMMVTVKRRFVHELIMEVSSTVSDPMQVEDEIRALMRDLERRK